MKRIVAIAFALSLALAGPAAAQTGQGSPYSIQKGGTGVGTAPAARVSLGVVGFTPRGDADYTILPTDRTVGTSAALTAPRTWTLPPANSVATGDEIVVVDMAGGVSVAHPLAIQRAGSDTVNGGAGTTIRSPFGGFRFRSDGVSKWSGMISSPSGGGALSEQIKTPMDYGAVCDAPASGSTSGSTNDTTALQAWLDGIKNNAAIGFIPAGKHCGFAGWLGLRNSTTIYGYGGSLRIRDGSGAGSGIMWAAGAIDYINGSSNTAIFGLTVDGNRVNQTNTQGEGALLYMIGSERVTLRDVRAINGRSDGFGIGGAFSAGGAGSVFFNFANIEAVNNYRTGLAVFGASRGHITGSIFNSTSNTNNDGTQCGVDIEADYEAGPNTDIVIENSTAVANGHSSLTTSGNAGFCFFGGYNYRVVGNNLFANSNHKYGYWSSNSSTNVSLYAIRGTANGTSLTYEFATDLLASGSGGVTPAALSQTNDTNVTLTLGGSPSTALLQGVSLTMGWSGQLAVARGGTGLASGTSGGVPCFTGSTTMASSAALPSNGLVYGGGYGQCPAATAAATAGQLFIGQDSVAPAPKTMSGDATIDALGAITIANHAVTAGKIAQSGAATLFGNPTGSTADNQSFTVQSLANKASPDTANDKIMILDAAAGVFKYSTVGQVSSAGVSGVSSVGGATGAITVGNGIEVSGGELQLAFARRTLPTTTVLTSGTNATYNKPANALWIEITMVGSGGGGGGGGSGGGDGSAGGDTCWKTSGTACDTPDIVAGGGGGTSGQNNGGAGGTAAGGDVNVPGSDGGFSLGASNTVFGGAGGASTLGGAGRPGAPGANGTPSAGKTNSGSGGGGGTTNNAGYSNGGGGGAGATTKKIITSPAASYVYTIGAPGTGGSAGSAGLAGADGAAGVIIVVEHYGT